MPYCCVPGCSNSWKTGHSMHRLPTNVERKQQWLANIGRNDIAKNWWFVCAVHFPPEMWEKPRVDGKKKLKCNAIPIIFIHRNKNKITTALPSVHDSEMNRNSSNDKVHITASSCVHDNEIVSNFSNDEVHTTAAAAIFKKSSSVWLTNLQNTKIGKPLLIDSITNLQKTTSKLQNTLLLLKRAKEEAAQIKLQAEIKLNKANAIISKLVKSNTLLKKNVRKCMDENKKLTQKIRNLEANKGIDIRKIFNDDQITTLNRQYSRCPKWSNNTITKALRLKKSCGSTGYKELLNQNIPLPSERTLRRKLEDDREKDCILIIDEMSIAAEHVDQSATCSFGLSTLPDIFSV